MQLSLLTIKTNLRRACPFFLAMLTADYLEKRYKKYLAKLLEKKGTHDIQVAWTGGGWCLCSGEWVITVDGIDCSDIIPHYTYEDDEDEDEIDPLRTSDMNTYGSYPAWFFDGWSEEWEEPWSEEAVSGLFYKEWIKENKYWVEKLPIDPIEWPELYAKISEQDFRMHTCGGCI